MIYKMGNNNGRYESTRMGVPQRERRSEADWTVRLRDLATEKERGVLNGHRGGVHCLAFSSDGHTLATGSADESVKLWDTATWKERTTLSEHRSGISADAFSPDDRTLASAGMDDAVRLWTLVQP